MANGLFYLTALAAGVVLGLQLRDFLLPTILSFLPDSLARPTLVGVILVISGYWLPFNQIMSYAKLQHLYLGLDPQGFLGRFFRFRIAAIALCVVAALLVAPSNNQNYIVRIPFLLLIYALANAVALYWLRKDLKRGKMAAFPKALMATGQVNVLYVGMMILAKAILQQ